MWNYPVHTDDEVEVYDEDSNMIYNGHADYAVEWIIANALLPSKVKILDEVADVVMTVDDFMKAMDEAVDSSVYSVIKDRRNAERGR